jgi:hypothetical protein
MISPQHIPTQPYPYFLILTGEEQHGQMTLACEITAPPEISSDWNIIGRFWITIGHLLTGLLIQAYHQCGNIGL